LLASFPSGPIKSFEPLGLLSQELINFLPLGVQRLALSVFLPALL
jgi:hypothetical protein